MELKAGYKQTRIGIIPVDWRKVTVEEISTVGRGRVISHKEIARSRDARYPVYSSQTAGEGVMGYLDRYDFEGEYVTWTTDGENAGTVFARNGKFNCTNVCGTVKLRADNYLFVAAALNRVTERHVSRHVGNPKLMNGVMKKIAFALPERREEQDAIATALSDVDALLVAQGALIAKKRAIKQGAMQELLTGKRRLPGFSGEWQVKRLGDHLEFLGNGANSRAELMDDGRVRYLHYGDIHGTNEVLLNPTITAMPFLPEVKAVRLDRLRDGDLVFADASEDLDGVGKSVELQSVGKFEVVSGMHTIAVRFDKGILADGFKAYLQFIPSFQTHLRRLASGTKVYATNMSHIASAEVKLPSPAEQVAISAVFTDMDTELTALEAQRAKTAQLKQGMMQTLLTGRIRLV